MEEKILMEIAKEVKDNGGSKCYDTWGNSDRSNKYTSLKIHLIDQNKNGFKVDSDIFIVEFRYSNGINSMGGTPDSILVKNIQI